MHAAAADSSLAASVHNSALGRYYALWPACVPPEPWGVVVTRLFTLVAGVPLLYTPLGLSAIVRGLGEQQHQQQMLGQTWHGGSAGSNYVTVEGRGEDGGVNGCAEGDGRGVVGVASTRSSGTSA